MAQLKYGFTIEGIAPLDIDLYGEHARREFWKAVVAFGLVAKDRELAQGRDRFGARLTPITPWTRRHRRSWTGKASPSAQPLTPAYAGSRTRVLLDGRATRTRAEFFWRADPVTGRPWGRILGYHRDGAGHLPERDVIGLSTQSEQWVKTQALTAWNRIRAGSRAPKVERPGSQTAATKRGAGLKIAGGDGVPPVKPAPAARPATPPGPKPLPPIKSGGTRGKPPEVVYLPRSAKPSGTSRKVQVYYTPGPGPGPTPAPAAKPQPQPKPKASPKPKSKSKAKATPAPKGTPVSQALQVRAQGVTADTIRETIAAIDQVHGDGNLPAIPVQEIASRSYNGSFHRNVFTGEATLIEVSSVGTHRRLTTAHEIGHFLEKSAIPGAKSAINTRDWKSDPVLADWKKAVDDSDSVKQLRALKGGGPVEVTMPDGSKSQVQADNHYLGYLLKYDEIWARSYAQYIMVRSKNVETADEFQRDFVATTPGEIPYTRHWYGTDFDLIAKAMDTLFESLGWRE